MEKIENETCYVCHQKTLTLLEDEQDIPYFGKVFLFSMSCTSCHYKVADVEVAQPKDPCRIEFTVENEKDLSARLVRSSQASVKIPRLKMSLDPGVGAEGFVSNVEGLLQRFKKILEVERDSTDDPKIKKSAKNLLKKLWKVECGEDSLKVVIEDPSGNSAIIDEKALVYKLKNKQL